jgi:hypothetical protein
MKRNDSFVAPLPALLLAVIAALLTLPASLALWEQRALIDEQGFVARGNETLANEAVQRELAAGISEDLSLGGDSIAGTVLGGLLSSRGEASPLEGVLLTALDAVADTSASDLALAAVHNEVLKALRSEVVEADQGRIYLNLDDAIAQVTPGDVLQISTSAGRIEVVQESDMTGVFNVARWLDGRTLLLCLLPLAVLGMGFFVAPSPAEYARQFGLALFAVGALGAIVVRVVLREQVVGGAIDLERSRAAANAAYDIFTGSLLTQELVLAAAGLAIAGMAFVLTRREGVEA